MTVEEQATLLYLIEEYCNARINNLPASHQHGYSNIQQEIELLDKIKKTYKHKEGMMNRNHIEIMKEELGSEVSSLTSEMDRKIIGFQVQTKNGRLQMTKYRIEGDGRDLTSLIMTHDDGSEVCNFAITDGGLRVLKEAIELYQNGGLIERPAKAALLPNGDGDIVEDVLVKLVNPIEEIRRKNEH